MSKVVDDFLDRARDALARNDWEAAYALLIEKDQPGKLDAEGLELLGMAGQLSGHLEEALSAWERAHAAHLSAGRQVEAAVAAVQALTILFDIGSHARAKGWLRTADRLLQGMDETPAHGWLASTKAVDALLKGDVKTLLVEAQRTQEIGERLADPDLRAIGLHWQARGLILQGRVPEGMALLDEVATGAISGQFRPLTTAYIHCSTVCASQGVAEYRRAEEWTRAMEGWCERQQLSYFPGLCRVHRVEVMRVRGTWAQAEGEALRACGELDQYGPAEIGWALHELGMVRLRLGDLDGAEQAFMQAHERGRPPHPGLSLLQLARGDVDAAAASIRSVVDDPPDVRSHEAPLNTPLGRTTILPVQVEIALAAGDVERARWAADELGVLAERFGTEPLLASAAEWRGAVELAEGDAGSARRSFQTAISLWSGIGAPYETARSRMGLGRAHRAADEESLALTEFRSARGTFERLGATRDAELARQAAGDAAVAGERVRKTFMFTDIVGSTNLLDAMGDEAWGNVLRWHNDKIASVVREHGGTVLRTTGDGFFLGFDSPSDAAACAVAIQRALEEHRRGSGFAPRVRIGFHATEATREGEDFSGKGVHTAARIGALADGEEILTDVETLGAVSGAAAADRRTVSLKGLAEPMEIASITWR